MARTRAIHSNPFPLVVLALALAGLFVPLRYVKGGVGRSVSAVRQLEDPVIEEPIRPLLPVDRTSPSSTTTRACGRLDAFTILGLAFGVLPFGLCCSLRKR